MQQSYAVLSALSFSFESCHLFTPGRLLSFPTSKSSKRLNFLYVMHNGESILD